MISTENKVFADISSATYREDIVSFINYLETKYSPEDLTIGGHSIWPLLRRIIASEKENLVLGFRLFPNWNNNEKHAVLSEELSRLFQKTTENVSELHNATKFSPDSIPNELLNSEILFYSRPSRYLEKSTSGNFINTDIDQEFLLFNDITKCAKIELDHKKTQSTLPREHFTYIISSPQEAKLQINWLGTKEESKNYIEFRKQIINEEAVPASIIPNLRSLVRLITNIRIKKNIFLNILQKVKPKAVAVSLYYDSNEGTMSLIWACKELGIPTFELQHGLIGSHHWAFTHWTAFPNTFYNTLPDFFWVWDQHTKTVLDKSNGHSKHSPRSLVAKNIKSYSLDRRDTNEVPHRTKRHLKSICESYSKIVLFSQQYGLGMTPGVVISAIKDSPPDWLWLIRLHPLARPLAETWRLLLDDAQVSNYEIEFSNLISISDTFDLVDHVVTSFSTTAFEALAKGVPCTIISNIGFDSYQFYIETGALDFALTAETIIDSIQKRRPPVQLSLTPKSLSEVQMSLDEMYNIFRPIL